MLCGSFEAIFTTFGQTPSAMTKILTAEVQRKNAERQLFGARRALAHLVQLYDSGQWRQHYKKEDAFTEAVRQARLAVDHWSEVVSKSSAA
jgi:hypothetical protein